MPEPGFTALEFPELLRVVQTYAVSDLGRDFLGGLAPIADLHQIQAPFRKSTNCVNSNTVKAPSPLPIFPT